MKRAIFCLTLLLLPLTLSARGTQLKLASATAPATVSSGAAFNVTATLNGPAPSGAAVFVYGESGPVKQGFTGTPDFKGNPGTVTFAMQAGTVTTAQKGCFDVNAYSVTIQVCTTVEPSVGTTTYVLGGSPAQISFGNETVGQTATQNVTLTNTGTGVVTVASITREGSLEFADTELTPITSINPGASQSFGVTFSPTSAGAVTGAIVVSSNAPLLTINLSGTAVGVLPPPVIVPKSLTAPAAAYTGPAQIPMTLTLSAAPASATAVSLTSSSPAVTVPATLSFIAGTVSEGFTANVNAVTLATAVTLTATLNSASASFIVTDNPPAPPPVAYKTVLSWGAPAAGSDPAVKYAVSRNGVLLATVATLTYTDLLPTSVDGTTAIYSVSSVDANGVLSAPATINEAIP